MKKTEKKQLEPEGKCFVRSGSQSFPGTVVTVNGNHARVTGGDKRFHSFFDEVFAISSKMQSVTAV